MKPSLDAISEACALNALQIAITVLDTAHLHEMHEKIAAEELNPHYPDRLRMLITLIDCTAWPATLESKAYELRRTMESLMSALGKKNLESAKPIAGKMHGLYHSLVKDFYEMLQSKKELMKPLRRFD